MEKFKISVRYLLLTTGCLLLSNVEGFSQSTKSLDSQKKQIAAQIDQNFDAYRKDALALWGFAELGYKEFESSKLLSTRLSEQGFKLDSVKGIPTAFVATYGSGKPVVAFLAEYDALPGFSQKAIPEKTALSGQANGHACGHNLFGVGSIAAALEMKRLLASGKLKGTVKVFGCPAEEGGSGKVYLTRQGLFKDVDVALHWHPFDENRVAASGSLANISAKFRFKGVSAHAARSPFEGRSALDGAEAFNHMVNLMREHVPQETRIHYVITNGGKAPNVVPDYTEVYLYVRSPSKSIVKEVFGRVVAAAKGAAMGTETEVDYEVIGGVHDLLINKTLASAMQENLQKAGGLRYTAADREFALKLQTTLTDKSADLKGVEVVQPLDFTIPAGGGSTDVGDVSYVVPTVGVHTAAWVPGVPAHSWQAVACSGTDLGIKGLTLATKVLVFTALDCFNNPGLINKATTEHKQNVKGYEYSPLLGDRPPALNYRN